MSGLSKAIVLTSLAGGFAMVAYVHLSQEWERKKLHEGVVKDLERQRLKRLQKLANSSEHYSNETHMTIKTNPP